MTELVSLETVVLDDSVERFLGDCSPGTAKTYRPALKHFTAFLQDYRFDGELVGTPNRFLDLVSADQALPVRQKRFIARAIIKGFKEYLERFAAKGVLTRIGAVQSYGKYYEVPISTKFTQMPEPIVVTKSYPWTLEKFEEFFGLMGTSLYRALLAALAQSGLGIGDALALRYKVIQEDFEAGVTPICLDLVRHKTSVPHVTFFSTETVELLKVLFEEESKPAPDDFLFNVGKRSVQEYFALRASKLLEGYGGRNPCGPHSFRKFFRKRLVNAGCPESYAEYWEGHNLKGDLRKIYTAMLNEEWRVEYRKYMGALSFKIV